MKRRKKNYVQISFITIIIRVSLCISGESYFIFYMRIPRGMIDKI